MWSINVPNVVSVSWPVSDGSAIYFQVSNSTLGNNLYSYALNGTLNWRSPYASRWQHYLGPIIVDGTLYFEGGTYGGLYSFNASNGAQQWYTPLPNYDSSSPTWWNGQLLAYTNRLDILDAHTGHLLATITDPNSQSAPPNQAPVVIGNFAFVTNGGRLVAFDLVNKSIAWTQAINATGQISTDGAELFVVSGGSLNSRHPASGVLLWSWTPPSVGLISNLIVTQSHVIASNGRGIFVVNRESHTVDKSWMGTAGDLLAFGEQTLVVASTSSRNISALEFEIELQACTPPCRAGAVTR